MLATNKLYWTLLVLILEKIGVIGRLGSKVFDERKVLECDVIGHDSG